MTLTLSQRIAWLHGAEGPRGKMSHDAFGKVIGATRQAIISWEKRGVEPRAPMRRKLARFSGFQAAVFSRREAEELAQESFGRRLARSEETLERILSALVAAGIAVPESQAAPRSASSGQPRKR